MWGSSRLNYWITLQYLHASLMPYYGVLQHLLPHTCWWHGTLHYSVTTWLQSLIANEWVYPTNNWMNEVRVSAQLDLSVVMETDLKFNSHIKTFTIMSFYASLFFFCLLLYTLNCFVVYKWYCTYKLALFCKLKKKQNKQKKTTLISIFLLILDTICNGKCKRFCILTEYNNLSLLCLSTITNLLK